MASADKVERDVDPELEDGSEVTRISLGALDLNRLASPLVLRSVGMIVLGLAVLAWPNRSDRILARLLGLALAWLALTSLRRLARTKPRPWITIFGAVASLGLGVVLTVFPDQSTQVLGRLLGLAVVGYALNGVYRRARSRGLSTSHWTLYALAGAIGAALIVSAETVLTLAVSAGAVLAIGVSAVVLAVSFDGGDSNEVATQDTVSLIGRWLLDRPKSVDARQALYSKILYEGATTRTRIVRFFALMGFAAVIASMGVITDSTAVVIGAMLVAPLMTPLMGMAISLVMGWPNRLARSALVAVGGIAFAIGVGVLLGLISPAVIDTASNTQILARTSPTVLDLLTAIAAGAAGAYGLSRPDVSDSLPGVAIAISLVPPLTVVGISYSQTDWAAGNGALLLFATNMVAILVVGGLTFVLTGVTPIARAADNQHRVRTAVGVTLTAGVLVVGALLLNGAEITANALRQSTVESTVEKWLEPASDHRIVDTRVEGSTVVVVVVGPSSGLPDVETLAEDLARDLDKPVTASVSLVVEERFSASSG